MTIEEYQRRLRNLGWKVKDLETQLHGVWVLWGESCGQKLFVSANTRREAWAAACSLALKVTFIQYGNDCLPNFEILTAEYECLKARSKELFEEWNRIDQRLLDIEKELPDDYFHGNDGNSTG